MNALAPLGLMLRHEARISWRQMTARTSSGLMLGTLIGLLIFAHLLALILPLAISQMPALPQVTVLAAFTAAGAFAMLMMISVALVGAVKFIYSRGDMDLLLSSPVQPQAIEHYLHDAGARYQTFTRFSGARYSFCSGLMPKAAYQASMLRTVCARKLSGACTSVAMRARSAGSRIFERQLCPKARKKRWSPLSPSITGASLPPRDLR